MTFSSWLAFGRPAPLGRGSVVGQKILARPYYSLARPYYSQRTVFASPLSAFFPVWDKGVYPCVADGRKPTYWASRDRARCPSSSREWTWNMKESSSDRERCVFSPAYYHLIKSVQAHLWGLPILWYLWYFPLSALTLLVGRQEGHLACKKTGCWFVGGDDLSGALHDL